LWSWRFRIVKSAFFSLSLSLFFYMFPTRSQNPFQFVRAKIAWPEIILLRGFLASVLGPSFIDRFSQCSEICQNWNLMFLCIIISALQHIQQRNIKEQKAPLNISNFMHYKYIYIYMCAFLDKIKLHNIRIDLVIICIQYHPGHDRWELYDNGHSLGEEFYFIMYYVVYFCDIWLNISCFCFRGASANQYEKIILLVYYILKVLAFYNFCFLCFWNYIVYGGLLEWCYLRVSKKANQNY